MTSNNLINKSMFILLVFLIAGVTSTNIRAPTYDDPWCSCWDDKGICCLRCSDRCYMDKNGKCHPVSDWCKTWDNCTGLCTCCYDGYGKPVNGVCAGAPETPAESNCAKYGWIDVKQKIYSKYNDGCKKVCIECECGYYLTCDYKCVALPPYCLTADKWGNCTCCEKGYKLDCGKCIKEIIHKEPIVVVDYCIQYGYLDYQQKWLKIWQHGCKKVCKVCDCDYYLTCNYTCAPLPKYCKSADIYGKCTDCIKGYHLEKGICVIDEEDHCIEYGWIDSGKKWHDYEAKGCKKVCKCCEKGYYLNEFFKCCKLPKHCKQVDSKGKCCKCSHGYQLNEHKVCVKIDDHCAEYCYIDIHKKVYSKWFKRCKKICKCCEKGYYLNEYNICCKLPQNCQEADCYGKCIKCCHGFVLKGDKCVVDDHCEVYGWIDSGKKWYDHEARGCKKVCKCCEKGYYLNNEYKCVQLPPYCEKADENGKCIDCCKGYKLCDGICIIDDHCQVYGWIDSGKKWYDHEARGCKKVCKCCEKGYYLDSNYKCVQLPPYCQKVDKHGNCIDCCKGYKLCDGICVIDDHCEVYGWIDSGKKWYDHEARGCKKVCKCCEKGFYLDSNYKCVQLPPYCQKVNKHGECIECCRGYELCDGKCVEKGKSYKVQDKRRY